MITYEGNTPRYYDRNGVEITEGCTIRFPHADKCLERKYEVYRTDKGLLGTDATNPAWIASGKAAPCEFGIYPLSREDTELCEVVEE